MKPKKVLIVYKKSTYEIYFLEHRHPLFREFRASHELHHKTLLAVQFFLKGKGVQYRVVYRAKKMNYAPYDLVITVGGDGTFLEAARRVTRQKIVGINSDPKNSVGSFCTASPGTFKAILNRFFEGRAKVMRLNRLKLILNGKAVGVNALNDILVGNRNPAAMSRYWVKVGGVKEEQRSSGLWVSTAAGSTGAIHTAGGKVLDRRSKKVQYMPRELNRGLGMEYRLRGGLIPAAKSLKIGSMMRDGMLYIDGPHFQIPFRYGGVLEILNSPSSLNVAH